MKGREGRSGRGESRLTRRRGGLRRLIRRLRLGRLRRTFWREFGLGGVERLKRNEADVACNRLGGCRTSVVHVTLK